MLNEYFCITDFFFSNEAYVLLVLALIFGFKLLISRTIPSVNPFLSLAFSTTLQRPSLGTCW